MNRTLSRRSLIEASLGASVGFASGRLLLGQQDDSHNLVQSSVGSNCSVKEFGAKGDGSTDDAKAFQAAITAASRANGVVFVPASPAKYLIGSSLVLAPNTTIQGAGGPSPTLRFIGSGDALFTFIGTREAEWLSATLSHLALESASSGSGVAVRVRNFSGLFLRHIAIDHFQLGLSADWGIGVHLYGCSLVRNTRAVQVGGAGPVGGIRGGSRHEDPFMDTVVVDACGFAQNGLDVNDMGSTRALGGTVIRDCSFFEAYATPVPDKRLYVRIANRKGLTICGNWFECGQSARTLVYLGDHDHDGNVTGMCRGAAVFGNDFLHTGRTGTKGIDVARCEGANIFANCFEFAPGNGPICLTDTAGRNTIGHNAYVTYPDQEGYADPIAALFGKDQVLDPRLPTRLGSELQVSGRVASAVAVPAHSNMISTDASTANYFPVLVTDRRAVTIHDPVKPTPGQQIVYDIRNSSGGVAADIAWGRAFHLAGPFIAPADAKRRTISFYYDGSAWIEVARAAADIANVG